MEEEKGVPQYKKYDALSNVLTSRNAHAEGVMKLLNEYYPAFAKKIFERNPLVEAFVRYNYTTLDILLHPICGRCETVALFSGYAKNDDGTPMLNGEELPVKKCRCPRCGTVTINPVTVLEFCLMEMKKRAPETLEMDLILATDIVAERLLADAKRIYQITKENDHVPSPRS